MNTLPTNTTIPQAQPFQRKHAAHLLPQDLIDFADEAEERFLGDFTAASDFAVRSGVPVLITGAALPLESRKEILRDHLAARLGMWLGQPLLAGWVASLPAAEQAAVRSGAMPIHEIDLAATHWRQREEREIQDEKAAAKEQLWSVLRGALHDAEGREITRPTPKYLVMRDDGETRVFYARQNAIEFARELSGSAFIGKIEDHQIQHCTDDEISRRRAARLKAESKPADKPDSKSPQAG